MSPAFTVRAADWNLDEAAIAQVRRVVFIDEQGVPEALEWEVLDAECAWFVAHSASQGLVGIVRLTAAGRIGRMAVLPAWRGHGVGRTLLAAVLQRARELGIGRVHLSAQTHAIGFYAHHGFVVEGPEYLDAGIPHRSMLLQLEDSR